MAGTTLARAAALFMAICVLYGTGSSQSVPDGQVYTEVKKTLVVGFPGVLTCRFFGDPVAVFWKKGHDIDDLDRMLVYHDGEVSGPRYDDKSCDIDENYSLIIRNVSTVDAGRIYCIVSNYRGILINNYTDVFVADAAVETRSEEILQVGQGTYGIVQCTVRIKASKVYWKKGDTSPANRTLVVLENEENQAARSGYGYDEGMYNITEDYSLIMKNVQVHHEGLYVCEATDFDTAISFQSHTFVNVIAYPRKPFPTIQECVKTEQNDSHYCILDAKSEILTCQVMEYYPDIHLFFLQGSKVIEPFYSMEWNNTDGTKSKTVKIAARERKEPYTCVASNIPGSNGRMSTSVLLHDEESFNLVLVIILVCFAALMLILLMVYFTWRRRNRHSNSNYTPVETINLQDKELKEYQTRLERVNNAFMKHYRMIYGVFNTTSNLQADRERIIGENKTSLFDIEKMLADWQESKGASYPQCTYMMQDDISPEEKSDHAWPSNDELRWISRHLNQESMKEICKKLKITYKPEDNDDEEMRYNSLREWRNKVAHGNIEKKHSRLSSVIGSKDIKGLLPPLKGNFVYKAELVDMAFNLPMQDLLPVAEALGINATKLVSYRPAFHPDHLEIGTIDLLSKLLKSPTVEKQKLPEKGDMRNFFYNKIGKLSYRNVATCGMIAYDMSYGELYAIKEAMASTKQKASFSQVPGDTSEAATQSEDGKREEGAASNMPEDGNREAVVSISEKAGVSQALPGTSKAATQSEEDKCEKSATSKIPAHGNKEETDTENFENETPQLVVSRNQIPQSEKADNDTATMGQRPGIRVSKVPEDLVDLQHVLQLTDQDMLVADGLAYSHPITAYALFRIWKETPRPSVFNYRAALALELRGIQMPDLADEVIAGKYIREHRSFEFIRNMVKGMNQDQLRILGKILGLSGKDEQWHTSTPIDVISKQISEWMAKWTTEMKKSSNVVIQQVKEAWNSFKEVSPINTTKSERHRDLNDKLVAQGFLELAREIMIIEQQEIG